MPLRDQVARVTFLIEGEVAEASDLSLTPPAATVCSGPNNGVFLFTFKHSYTHSQAGGEATICYYNDSSNPPDLYRFGPKFHDQTGALLRPTTAIPSSLRLVSPGTDLSSITVDQGLLKYSIKIGIDASGNGSIWDLSYAPSSEQVARIGTACMPISSTSSAGCW